MTSTSTRPLVLDQFRSTVSGPWTICESTSDGTVPSYDKDIYLARLRGPMALYDGTSLNNRWYSKQLWSNAIEENKDRMKQDGMFGTLGHERVFDEESLENGLITHKITNLWLNESDKTVHGEILVLNTSAGRELNTYLRSGMKISTSSRAYGTFKGKRPDGADIIDENGFYLHGFDFVLNPGVESACPRLIESVNEERKTKMELNEKQIMENAMEKAELKSQISEAQRKADKATQQLSVALTERKKLNESLVKAKRSIAFIAKNLNTDSPAKVSQALNEGLGKWLMVPELQDLAREIGMFDTNGTSADQTVKKLVESAAKTAKTVKAFQAVAESPEALHESIKAKDAELALYRAFGTPEALKESAAAWDKVASTPEVAYRAVKMLEAYKKATGGLKPEEIGRKLQEAQEAINLKREAKKISAAKKIIAGLKMHESKEPVVLAMLDKMSAKEAIAHLKALRKTNESKQATAPVKKSTVVPTKVNESAAKKPATPAKKAAVNGQEPEASRALRLVESVNMKFNPVTTPDPFQSNK